MRKLKQILIAALILVATVLYAAKPTVLSDPIIQGISEGQVITIEGKHFKDDLDNHSIFISGPGANSNTEVIIKNCLFENVVSAIKLEKIGKITIIGSRFYETGQTIRVMYVGELHVEYNELEKGGVLIPFDLMRPPYDQNDPNYKWPDGMSHFIVVQGCNAPGSTINYNIVDLSKITLNASRTDNKSCFEDFINTYGSGGEPGNPMEINSNKLRGHPLGGAASGGGIVIGDGASPHSHDFIIKDNILVNTNQYGLGCAGATNALLQNNQVYISTAHDAGLVMNPYHGCNNDNTCAADGPGVSWGVVNLPYPNDASGVNENINYKENIAVNGYNNQNIFGSVGCAFENNNFTADNSVAGPKPVPAGFGANILPDDMFANLDNNYFSGGGTTTDYTLTVNATNGSVSKSPNQATYNGETVTLTATPNSGYIFNNWSGDASGTSTTATVIMNSNKTVTANFSEEAATIYTLTVNATNGTVSKSPDKANYNNGETVTLTATANSGYQFNNWSGDASGTSTSVDVTMNSNKTVTANFSETTTGGSSYKYLKFTATAGSNIKINEVDWMVGSTSYPTSAMTSNNSAGAIASGDAGSLAYRAFDNDISDHIWVGNTIPYEVKLELTDAIEVTGLKFTKAQWSGLTEFTAHGSVDGVNWTLLHTETGIERSSTVTEVTFEGTTPPLTYTLTVNSTNGSVSKSPDKVNYNDGETVTLTATANSGYQFDNWSGDASGTSTSVAVTMNSNKTVTANFSEEAATTYTLSVNATNGTVSKSPDKANYNDGETVTLTATANSGYQFDNWSGDASGTSTSVDVTMNSNKTVTANFSEESTGGSSYKYLKFTATAGSNIKINEVDWMVGSTSYPTSAMTTNNSAGAIASGGAGSLAYRAFDNDLANHLWVGNATPYEFSIQLGSAIEVTGLKLRRGAWSQLSEFTAHGSNDGVNWTLLHTETGLSSVGGSDAGIEVVFSSSKTAESPLTFSDTESIEHEISVYPNPSSGLFKFNSISDYKGEVVIKIFTIAGAQIETVRLMKQETTLSYQVDLFKYKSGVYIIKYEAGKYQSINRIIKD